MSVGPDTVTVVALTVGLEAGVLAVTCGVAALLMRVLRSIDLAAAPERSSGTDAGPGGGLGADGGPSRPSDQGGEPAWWPEFERQLADWAALRRSPTAGL